MISSKALFVVIAQMAICCFVCRHVHADSVDIAEKYTVWPKDNASRLPEDYPWPSCDKTTGSQCPGLIISAHVKTTKDVRKETRVFLKDTFC